MKELKNIKEHIDDVKSTLYDRQVKKTSTEHHNFFEDDAESVSYTTNKDLDKLTKSTNNTGNNNFTSDGTHEKLPVLENDVKQESVSADFKNTTKRRYRGIVLITSIVFFISVSILSGLFFFFKGGIISNNKLEVSITKPPFVRGGEESDFNVVISNNNAVALDSVVLTMNYPEGTRTIDNQTRTLLEERIDIGEVKPGEVKRIPVPVVMFGDSGTEKSIKASVEYRLQGSNGIFYKESKPIDFAISSSPIVFSVDSIEKVSSGQYVDVNLTLKSNSSIALSNLIVQAFYPNNINFESSSPSPVYGNNIWKIDELAPNSTKNIKLKVKIEGFTKDLFSMNFNVGLADLEDKYSLKSVLAKTKTDFLIENPFINTVITAREDGNDNVNKNDFYIAKEGDQVNLNIDIENTLDEIIYDLLVEVKPKGNVIDARSIISPTGFYDSNSNSVTWSSANNPVFSKVLPGDKRHLSFEVDPNGTKSASSFEVFVNVYARRVFENKVIEKLIGTSKAKIKFYSDISIGGQAGRNIGFTADSGPLPPQVGKVTTYSLSLVAEAGNNDVSDVVVNTSLPIYVNWLDNYKADGEVFYNEVSKTLEWKVGDISANRRKQLTFQVSVKPSVSQVGENLILLNDQTLVAHENFADIGLNATGRSISNELSTEMGYSRENGVVTY